MEERFPISEQGYIVGKLLHGTECQILLDMGTSKLFMPKTHYLTCKSLHSSTSFASKTQRIPVGNGQYVSVFFIIPIVMDILGHRFEIFTLVSETHENIDLLLGIKNEFELEGIINSRELCFSFLNRSLPLFPKEQVLLRPREQFIKVEAPFIDEISGLTIIKMLDKRVQSTLMLKLKFVQNLPTLDVTNISLEMVILDPKEILGILDLKLIGYYKIKQGILQQTLSKYDRFESADVLCKQFNKFINTLKNEKEEMNNKYPWLDQNDERRNMSDREILEKHVQLERSCLLGSQKKQLMVIL